jgi:hypothetical protein
MKITRKQLQCLLAVWSFESNTLLHNSSGRWLAAGTHNEYQLHEESDEAHHNETNSSLGADLVELCTGDTQQGSFLSKPSGQTAVSVAKCRAGAERVAHAQHATCSMSKTVKSTVGPATRVKSELRPIIHLPSTGRKLTLAVRLGAALHKPNAVLAKLLEGLHHSLAHVAHLHRAWLSRYSLCCLFSTWTPVSKGRDKTTVNSALPEAMLLNMASLTTTDS